MALGPQNYTNCRWPLPFLTFLHPVFKSCLLSFPSPLLKKYIYIFSKQASFSMIATISYNKLKNKQTTSNLCSTHRWLASCCGFLLSPSQPQTTEFEPFKTSRILMRNRSPLSSIAFPGKKEYLLLQKDFPFARWGQTVFRVSWSGTESAHIEAQAAICCHQSAGGRRCMRVLTLESVSMY